MEIHAEIHLLVCVQYCNAKAGLEAPSGMPPILEKAEFTEVASLYCVLLILRK